MSGIGTKSLIAALVVLVVATAAPVALAPGARSAAAVTSTPQAASPAVPSAMLVDLLYPAMLSRNADDSGRAYWSDRLESGDPATDVVTGLGLSSEGRHQSVKRMYDHLLDRPGDSGGVTFWTGVLTESARADLVAALLLSSTEAFTNAGATPSGFVDAAYEIVLGRPADSGGSVYWLDRFADQLGTGLGRFEFVHLLLGSSEATRALVTRTVTEVCGEAPNATEAAELASIAHDVWGDPVLMAGFAVLVACAPTVGIDLLAGSASRSILPTVDGTRDYIDAALPPPSDAFDPGVFVPEFDQGQINVDNGREDALWVHDDLRVSAVALSDPGTDQIVVLVSADVYMVLAPDAAEITRRAKDLLPTGLRDRVKIVIAATHNHHGPVTAFGVNDAWYSMFADQAAATVVDAIDDLAPAVAAVAQDQHRFGVSDVRAPDMVDPRLNLLHLTDAVSGATIATVVQWSNHTETTLFWEPPGTDPECTASGEADCTAEGRYLTADYPGVLREKIQDNFGGEVVYFNGPIGSQIGPADAPVWQVDAAHPVGNGWDIPDGALPATPGATSYTAESFAKATAIGDQLATHVGEMIDVASPLNDVSISTDSATRFTRLSNIGFRYLLAHGGLGWQDANLFTCEGEPSAATCTSDGGAVVSDAIVEDTIRVGDFTQLEIISVDLGDVGFMFLPGELSPELVIGLPAGYDANPAPFHVDEPGLHTEGADYTFPGYLLDLVDESVTFTVGLGNNELGYFVPRSDFRVLCVADEVLGEGACADLYDNGKIAYPDAVSGETCHTWADTGVVPDGRDATWVSLSCKYGQALGEADGHYEETNAAGWDLVEDLWDAAVELYGNAGSGSRMSPDVQAADVLPPDPSTFPAPPAG